MDTDPALRRPMGEFRPSEAETQALREALQSARAATGRAEARVLELESDLRRAHEEAATERDRANRIANRRIVRAALTATRPIRPLFRWVRRMRRSGDLARSNMRDHADENQLAGSSAEIDAAALIPALDGKPRTTILIPVHDALGHFQRCMDSLLRNTSSMTPIIIIDDASTDPDVAPYLDSIEKLENVRVLRNKDNLGFVRSVNRGFAEAGGDVVVLNSDTVVTPRWLQNLTIAAYRADDIGTATPLSDNAGAFAVPIPGTANHTPEHLDSDDLGRLVTQGSLRFYPDTPTGHGFCMFVKRAMLDDVGVFNEEVFPRGYGEENDLCMRAHVVGWRHVVDDATLVLHSEGASFGITDRQARIVAARQVVDERYPAYARLVHEFMTGHAMTAVRSNTSELFRTAERERISPRPRILYVLHEGDGGTPETNRDLMFAVEEHVEPWLLTSTGRRLLLHRVSEGEIQLIKEFDVGRKLTTSDTTDPQYRQIVTSVLLAYGIELVHVRQLIKHTLDLPQIAAALDIPVVLSLHDFYFVCPTVHLLDNHGRWCAGQCTQGDGVCAAPRPDPSIHLKHSWVYVWQDHVRRMFSHIDAFVTTTPFTRELYRRVYPELSDRRFTVIEHGRDLAQHHGLNEVPVPGGQIRIAIVGNLAPHKGAGLVRQIREADHAGRLEFHFLGRISDENRDLGVAHGTYRRADLPNRLADIAPHFVGLFSTWGETYSHTLTEAWACGIPVVASQLGALGERVSARGGGWLIDPADPEGAISIIYAAADDTEEYRRQADQADIDGLPSRSDMAKHYLHMYQVALANGRVNTGPANVRAVKGAGEKAAGRLPSTSQAGKFRLEDLPNLLIAGTQKAGTTWLHAQLKRHPEIFLSEVKEIGYLHSGKGSIHEYLKHFEGSGGYRWRGEATPFYFWRQDYSSPFSPSRSHDTAEYARTQLGERVTIIVSLRDPVSRAISGYFHHLAMGRYGPEQSILRCPPKLGVVDLGFYSRHWKHWANIFGADRLHALLFDDLVADPELFLTQALKALNVDTGIMPHIEVDPIGRRPGIVELKRTENPVSAQEVAALLEIYQPEISFVEELTGRELQHWRSLDLLLKENSVRL